MVAAVADEEHSSLGVQEALRDGARRTRRSSPSQRTGRSSSPTRASCGRRSRCAGAPRTARCRTGRGRDRGGGAGAGPAGRARRVAAAIAPAARARLGARLADRWRHGARDVPGVVHAVDRAAHAAGGERRRSSWRRCSATPTGRSRVTLVREPFTVDPEAEIVRLVRSASGAEIAGAPYWTDAAFIAAAGIPTVLFGPGGEGAHADVEWVSLSDTRGGARNPGRGGGAAGVREPGVRPGGRARRRRVTRSRSTAALPGYAPTPGARAVGDGRRQGRVEPARAAGVQDPRRVVGGRARAAGAPRRAHAGRRERGQPRPRGRARGRDARAARRVFLPARSLPARREAIAGEGAEVVIVDGTYEDAVARAAAEARAPGVLRARRRGRVRAGGVGDRRLRDAVRRAPGAVGRDPRPDRRRLAGRGRGALRSGCGRDRDRRRAGDRRVPDRGAAGGRAGRDPDPGHDDGRPGLRDRLRRRVVLAAARASAARSPSPTSRRTRRWPNWPTPACRSANPAPRRWPRCPRWRVDPGTRVLLIATEGLTEPDGYAWTDRVPRHPGPAQHAAARGRDGGLLVGAAARRGGLVDHVRARHRRHRAARAGAGDLPRRSALWPRCRPGG